MAKKWDDEMIVSVMRGLGVFGEPLPAQEFSSICAEQKCSLRNTCTGEPGTRLADCPIFTEDWAKR